jgi:arylsulfatase A-like enzyme
MSREACELIEKHHQEGPFFMYYAEFNVHTPFNARQDLIHYYAKKAEGMGEGKHRNAIYAAMVHGLDNALGRILDKLDELDISENTVVIFVSDNGGVSWEKSMSERATIPFPGYEKWLQTKATSNAPLRGHKHTYYEGGVRVPMIIRWPGVVDEASSNSKPVHVIDFYPTLLEIAGVNPREDHLLDGVSLVPLLKGRNLKARPLFCHFPRAGFGMEGGSFVRQGDYKLIRIYGDGPDRADRFELYDIEADIGETRDLSDQMPDKVNELTEVLNNWLDKTGALMPKKNPDYVIRK